jgi:hypothetical protein
LISGDFDGESLYSYQAMKMIYESARSQAMGANEALEKIFEELA